ncbi:hypothetical protein ILUMI_13525 [Ignelater luminosus]|uniref:60S ribosomal protein L13 n=1 Tax=Ignelater luminosus TaxID=2038154 RepID=A0A8K0GBW1_IGNLU|nr:hypothetical protein ILUMI_13525 [Ignelater luminosus]
MVRHNNAIPNGHFHKRWQKRVKTWFDQPMRKRRRARKRNARINRKQPMPCELLRPMVHCPSTRYNSRIRVGRGFTLRELKVAGLNQTFAQTIGIAVDVRRRNKCVEATAINIQRLKEYRSKLLLFPLNRKKQKEEMKKPFVPITKGINEPIRSLAKLKARTPTKEEKEFECYHYVAKARAESKYLGRKLRRKRMKNESIELPPLKKVRLHSQDMD